MAERCRLCGAKARLAQSHIIPAFATRWIKETSVTGRLRSPETPNVPRQDVPRVRLLCPTCEEKFSAWETRFAERVFAPSRAGGRFAMQYEEWLLRFLVSIAWRSTTVESDKFASAVRHLAEKVDKALKIWRDYLLSERADAGPYEHHVFIASEPVSGVQGVSMPPKFNFYMLRAVDTTLAMSFRRVLVYTKLPGIVLLSAIEPEKIEGMIGTRIRRRGVLSSPQRVAMLGFGDFLVDRARTFSRMLEGMSDRQQQKMEELAGREPQRVLKSDSYRVFLADKYWQDRLGNK